MKQLDAAREAHCLSRQGPILQMGQGWAEAHAVGAARSICARNVFPSLWRSLPATRRKALQSRDGLATDAHPGCRGARPLQSRQMRTVCRHGASSGSSTIHVRRPVPIGHARGNRRASQRGREASSSPHSSRAAGLAKPGSSLPLHPLERRHESGRGVFDGDDLPRRPSLMARAEGFGLRGLTVIR